MANKPDDSVENVYDYVAPIKTDMTMAELIKEVVTMKKKIGMPVHMEVLEQMSHQQLKAQYTHYKTIFSREFGY